MFPCICKSNMFDNTRYASPCFRFHFMTDCCQYPKIDAAIVFSREICSTSHRVCCILLRRAQIMGTFALTDTPQVKRAYACGDATISWNDVFCLRLIVPTRQLTMLPTTWRLWSHQICCNKLTSEYHSGRSNYNNWQYITVYALREVIVSTHWRLTALPSISSHSCGPWPRTYWKTRNYRWVITG